MNFDRTTLLGLLMILAAACSSTTDAPANASPEASAVDASPEASAADSSPDASAAPSACASCASDEICVVGYDGACQNEHAGCRKKTPACQAPACTPECNRDLCGYGDGGVGTCNGPPCPSSARYSNAIFCYGP